MDRLSDDAFWRDFLAAFDVVDQVLDVEDSLRALGAVQSTRARRPAIRRIGCRYVRRPI